MSENVDYRESPKTPCAHASQGRVIDWMTPLNSKMRDVMWIERCSACRAELRREPFPQRKPFLYERISEWLRSLFGVEPEGE